MNELWQQVMDQPVLLLGGLILIAVIAIVILRRQAGSGIVIVQSAPPAAKAPPVDDSDLAGTVRALLAAGKKIEAVKLVRERTGLGLKEAKDFVDGLEQPAFAVPAIPMTPGQQGDIPGDLRSIMAIADDVNREVQALLAAGKKIEAIKLVCERTGMNLKQAKDLVERVERRLK